jgi:hypothetical protein
MPYLDGLVRASGLDPTRYRQLHDEVANLRKNLLNAARMPLKGLFGPAE